MTIGEGLPGFGIPPRHRREAASGNPLQEVSGIPTPVTAQTDQPDTDG